MTIALEPGIRVGRYRVVGSIGRGGMGGVFEVEDDAGQRYALKSPVQDIASDGELARRFAREANALRVLDHPNLVAAVDVFVEAGQLFLVMEKVVGKTLGKRLHDGPLPPREALVIARQILDGVAHAHARGMVHRDLKPENVLLVAMAGGWHRVKVIDFGLVKLLDHAVAVFGAASLTRTGFVQGTPAYMAPEQALGRVVDGRADLYAIGIMLHEMLAGKLPFFDPDPIVLMRHHAKLPPPPLRDATGGATWCTPALCALVERALVKDPAHRLRDAPAMIAALDEAFASLDHVA